LALPLLANATTAMRSIANWNNLTFLLWFTILSTNEVSMVFTSCFDKYNLPEGV